MSVNAIYLWAWLALAVIAVVNGVLRENTYGRVLGELRAHQLSTLVLAVAMTVFVSCMNLRWPIASLQQAWQIGVTWLVFTILFEFGFGHYLAGHSWKKLVLDYNLLQGRVWALFLVYLALLPALVYNW